VGNIEAISPVYQTPAIGFKGDDFLNCVVMVSSHFTPMKVLELIQEIEKKMGRIREPNKKMTSRTIDIDILFYDDLCMETEHLVLPHSELHHRSFVLEPMAHLNKQMVHPVLNKTIESLLKDIVEDCDIALHPKSIKNPINDFDLSGYRYIAIEGNIGAGKTSLATMMASNFNAKLILERFKENAFLPMFYKDPARFAFPLEMSFLADRYQQLLDDLTQYDLFKEYIIADYDCFKSMIFANITLQDEEYNLYKKIFHIMYKELPNPDVYIYLYQNTDRLLENIKLRGRSFEKDIEASYLNNINQGYMDFIKNQHSDNIKVIDISDLDFVKNRTDYVKILRDILG
jgi:2-amino-4-hydroxy-6-hydroxymethyldihydropteridine diphosphokinase